MLLIRLLLKLFLENIKSEAGNYQNLSCIDNLNMVELCKCLKTVSNYRIGYFFIIAPESTDELSVWYEFNEELFRIFFFISCSVCNLIFISCLLFKPHYENKMTSLILL